MHRGVWLRIAQQILSCAWVCGRGIVLRHHYKIIAKRAGKDLCDGSCCAIWMGVDVLSFILDCAFGGFPLHLPFRLRIPISALPRLGKKYIQYYFQSIVIYIFGDGT